MKKLLVKLIQQEPVEFRNQCEAAILNLRRRGLTLDQYLLEVRRMQDMAEGMLRQPTREMAMLWILEHRDRVKEPTLEEYLKMCEFKQNEKEKKENERELCN